MIESRSPIDLVLALVRVINGDAPRLAAREILDPMVQIRMDSAEYCGIDVWYKWIYLIHNCGRVANLRITHYEARCSVQEPELVHLSARWMGTIRSRDMPAQSTRGAAASYLVREGRIKKICTHKSNYEFIFGIWVRYLPLWIFLSWTGIHFMLLAIRRKDFLQGSVDCSGSSGGGC
jgi:hypothetical protein